jgi:hypothetical protein
MPWGGRREGAGRKPGSKLTKSQLIAAEVREAGVSPLEVQLRTMRALWAEATDSAGTVINFDKASAACSIARDCASYVHPRLAAVEARLDLRQNISPLSDAAMLDLLTVFDAAVDASPDAPLLTPPLSHDKVEEVDP